MEFLEDHVEPDDDFADDDAIDESCHEIIDYEKTFNKDIDNELKSLTKIMRELKVFGVPTFIYKKERFWGQDRLKYIKNINN